MSVAEQLVTRLPIEYRSEDRVLEVLLESIAPKLQEVDDAITNLGANFNPATAPDEWLGWLLEKIGWPVEESFTNYQKREILKLVGAWRKNYGKPGIIEAIIKLYFRPTAANIGLDVKLEARKSNIGSTRVGLARVDKERLWQRFSRNEILVTISDFQEVADNAGTRARLVQFLETLVPPFMTIKVTN